MEKKNLKLKVKDLSPWLAVILSMLVAGLGQFIVGAKFRGSIIFGVYFSLLVLIFMNVISPLASNWVLYFLFIGLICFYVFQMVDAYLITKKQNSTEFEDERKPQKDPWLAFFLSLIMPGVGHFYIRRWMVGILFLIGFFLLGTLEGMWKFLYLVYALSVAFLAYKQTKQNVIVHLNIVAIIGMISLLLILGPPTSPFLKVMFQNSIMASNGMTPTLELNDRFFVYKFGQVKRGDIIVFHSPHNKKEFISRIVAMPGDIFSIKKGTVFLNGNALENTFEMSDETNFNEMEITQNHVFVMGDNRDQSFDSRDFGPVPIENIIGVMTRVYWPIK